MQILPFSFSCTNQTEANTDTVWIERAKTAGKVAACFTGVTALSAGSGLLACWAGAGLLQSAAHSSPLLAKLSYLLGNGLYHGGNLLFLAGKYSFLSVATPIYMGGYLFPKWCITQALPQSFEWAASHLIIPACQKAYALWEIVYAPLSKVISTTTEITYKYLLEPLAVQVSKAITTTVKALWPAIVSCARTLFSLEKWVYTHITLPIASVVNTTIQFLWNYTAVPFAQYILEPVCQASLFVCTNIVIPLSSKVASLAAQILTPIAEVSTHLLSIFYHYVLVPLAQGINVIMTPAVEAGVYVAQLTAELLTAVSTVASRFFSFA